MTRSLTFTLLILTLGSLPACAQTIVATDNPIVVTNDADVAQPAGNVASPPLAPVVIPVEPAPQPCDFDGWLGLRRVDAEKNAKETGRPYRLLSPGDMYTMDYLPARINVEFDDGDHVKRVFCG